MGFLSSNVIPIESTQSTQACTVAVASQQAEILRSKLGHFKVTLVGRGSESWTKEEWQQKFEETWVFVMAPEMFTSILEHDYFQLNKAALLILDECHHATKKHTYNIIMRNFYFKLDEGERPKIFATTASPLMMVKVNESAPTCHSKFGVLERSLGCKVFAVREHSQLQQYVPSPTQEIIQYNCTSTPTHIQDLLQHLLLTLAHSPPELKVPKMIDNAIYLFLDLGPRACSTYLHLLINQYNPLLPSSPHHHHLRLIINSLQEVTEALLPHLTSGYTSKMSTLIALLAADLPRFQDAALGYRAILFVERKLSARIIDILLKNVPDFTPIRSQTLLATDTDLDPDTGVIITTPLPQQGLHLPSFSLVIHFDRAPYQSYVQSRGRARGKKSLYKVMIPQDDHHLLHLIQDIHRTEETLSQSVFLRQEDDEEYEVPGGGRVSAEAAPSLVHHYCLKLPGDKYSQLRPREEYSLLHNLTLCQVTLPKVIRVAPALGRPHVDKRVARGSAYLQMCRQLHLNGYLSDNLTCDVLDVVPQPPLPEPKYLPQVPSLLSETWPTSLGATTWTLYTLTLDTTLWSLALLLPGRHDVEKEMHCTPSLQVTHLAVVHLTSSQLGQLYAFHQRLFQSIKSGLYGSIIFTRKAYLLVAVTEGQVDWHAISEVLSNPMPIPALQWMREQGITSLCGQVVTRGAGNYIVEAIDPTFTGTSLMSERQDLVSLTYQQYFANKGHHLQHAELPLLKVKRISLRGPEAKVHRESLPIELCTVMPISAKYWDSALLLLRHMFHWERMLLAASFQQELNFGFITELDKHTIQKCLTSRNVDDLHNYERLETLGDAFLKWKTSAYLYALHPHYHEGQLTLVRSRMIRNTVLRQLCINTGIHKYISRNPFTLEEYSVPALRESVLQTLPDKILADVVEALLGAAMLHNQGDHLLNYFKIVPCQHLEIALPTIDPNFDYHQLSPVEATLKYTFNNKELLRTALTHPSAWTSTCQEPYQRLEFLGDALLGFILTRRIVSSYPQADPGQITDLLSFLVNNDTFAELAVRNGFAQYLDLECPPLAAAIVKYQDRIAARGTDHVSILGSTFGADAPKALGDIWESIAGAIFLDCHSNLEVVERVFLDLMKDILSVPLEQVPIHPVRKLQEWCQKTGRKCQFKSVLQGEATVTLFINEVEITTQVSTNKRAAKLAAANEALVHFRLA
eukprot:TRINITY_DN5469_c0_g1_i11.p1 TRINITY_DN5469_c0_g1~~TRINITY_DN5469_c0_g1_i11.p1  ORF type:complete len:1197 (-),score=243.03 TRINITY_DN5469_c0_g1_i11:90-3680(-)